MEKIPGGYILIARKTFRSALMDKPPLYFKLWMWMLDQAAFKNLDNGLKRGQFVTTIAEMQDAMSWRVGYRKVIPSREKVRSAYEHFTNTHMITTTKTTRGMIVSILNYNKYQDFKSYEPHDEPTHEHTTNPQVTPHDRERRGKNVNKVNKTHMIKNAFDRWWISYPRKIGKAAAYSKFITKYKSKKLPEIEKLIQITKQHVEHWQATERPKDKIPHPTTWLNQERWEDVLETGSNEREARDARLRRVRALRQSNGDMV